MALIRVLGTSIVFQQRIRATDKDHGRVGIRGGQMFLDIVLGDIARDTIPGGGRGVEGIDHLESIGEALGIAVQFFLEQDIFFSTVTKDQSHLGLVILMDRIKHMTDDLKL